jgi:hypothetical protein
MVAIDKKFDGTDDVLGMSSALGKALCSNSMWIVSEAALPEDAS